MIAQDLNVTLPISGVAQPTEPKQPITIKRIQAADPAPVEPSSSFPWVLLTVLAVGVAGAIAINRNK